MHLRSKVTAIALGFGLILSGAALAQTNSSTTTVEKPDGQKSSSSTVADPSKGQSTTSTSHANPSTGHESSSTTTQHSDGTKTTTKTDKNDKM